MHLTKEEAEQEIKKLSECDQETKQYMNIINLYESGNTDMFDSIGFYVQDKATKKLYKVVKNMNLCIEINSLCPTQWKKVDLAEIKDKELQEMSFDEIRTIILKARY